MTRLVARAAGPSFDEGLRNPCLGRLLADLARHDPVLQAFDGSVDFSAARVRTGSRRDTSVTTRQLH